MKTGRIRVLVAEDSATQRLMLVSLLDEAGFDVVATVADGRAAVDAVERHRPDVVLMDCHMPVLSGFEATRIIMERSPTPIVVVSASLQSGDSSLTFDAIAAGALAVAGKPLARSHPGYAAAAQRLVRTLTTMASVHVGRRAVALDHPQASFSLPRGPALRAVGIGGSTGAPSALATILSGLPVGLPAAVLVVQHLAEGFAEGLAGWLASKTPLSVRLARAGETAQPGEVLIAPDGHQMELAPGGTVQLRREAAEESFSPSVDRLFLSMATAYGSSAVGVLLSGMGKDGAAGLGAMQRAGAVTVAQDAATSVIYGMPREAVQLGAAQFSLSPPDIARLIVDSARTREGDNDRPRQIRSA